MTDEQIAKLLEDIGRIAKANEDLISLAKDEREVGEIGGPPVCPHCLTLYPQVKTEEGGVGNLSTFVLSAECQNCHKKFIGIPEGWVMFKTVEEAKDEMQRREAR